METKYFEIDPHGAVVVARIRNPPHQFFTIDMLPELNALLDRLEADPEVTVLAFTGADPDVFLSHLDPGELQLLIDNPDAVADGVDRLSGVHHVLSRLGRCSFVTVAGVNGHAWGAGCEFALACDLRFLSDSQRAGMAMLEAVLGLTPGAGAAYRLRRVLGASRAFHMLLSAKALRSEEAYAAGLAHEILPSQDFHGHLLDRLRQLTFHTRESIRNLRRCTTVENGEEHDAHALEQAVYVDGLRSRTVHRRARTFLECRGNGNQRSLVSGMPAFLVDPLLRRKPKLIVQALTEYFDPERASGVSARYLLQIDGKHGGRWTVKVEGGTLKVAPGADGPVDVTMIASASDWVDFISGKASDVEMFVNRRMRVYGDLMKALEFESLFV